MSPMWTSSLLEGRREKLHCRWRPLACPPYEHATLPTITCKQQGDPLSMNECQQIQWFQQRQGTGLSLGPRSGFSM